MCNTHHVVPCSNDEFLLLVMSGPALLIVMLHTQEHIITHQWELKSQSHQICLFKPKDSYLQVLDFSIFLCQLVFQCLNVRSWLRLLLLRIQGFDHLHTHTHTLSYSRCTCDTFLFQSHMMSENVIRLDGLTVLAFSTQRLYRTSICFMSSSFFRRISWSSSIFFATERGRKKELKKHFKKLHPGTKELT